MELVRLLMTDRTVVPSGYRALIFQIRRRRLTYLPPEKLGVLATTCRSIEERGLEGMFIEAGCALGGSTILIAKAKSANRPFRVYDVFGMIPPPSEEDTSDVRRRYDTIARGEATGIHGDPYYGYEKDLHTAVAKNLERFGVDREAEHISLIKGLVQETLIVDQPVAFAHVDVDWYEPVKTCLRRIYPKLVEGGSIVIDDYHVWGGCRKATDEFLAGISGRFSTDDAAGSLRITKLPATGDAGG